MKPFEEREKMYQITAKEILNPTVVKMEILAPAVAKKALPGQFIILRVDEKGERIPLTVAGYDRQKGTVDIIFQVVGATTMCLSHKEAARAAAQHSGGGVGCAIAYPVAKELHDQGCEVHSIIGFRSRELLILEQEFRACSERLIVMSDDGSCGEKGLVTDALRALLEAGEQYDEVIAIGPLVMMKFVCALTREYGVKTVVSMNPIMVDGTGMCGGCRLTVGGKTKFACVDGPDFDGHEVDFDEALQRAAQYRDFEHRAYEETCNLFKRAEG